MGSMYSTCLGIGSVLDLLIRQQRIQVGRLVDLERFELGFWRHGPQDGAIVPYQHVIIRSLHAVEVPFNGIFEIVDEGVLATVLNTEYRFLKHTRRV